MHEEAKVVCSHWTKTLGQVTGYGHALESLDLIALVTQISKHFILNLIYFLIFNGWWAIANEQTSARYRARDIATRLIVGTDCMLAVYSILWRQEYQYDRGG